MLIGLAGLPLLQGRARPPPVRLVHKGQEISAKQVFFAVTQQFGQAVIDERGAVGGVEDPDAFLGQVDNTPIFRFTVGQGPFARIQLGQVTGAQSAGQGAENGDGDKENGRPERRRGLIEDGQAVSLKNSTNRLAAVTTVVPAAGSSSPLKIIDSKG